MKKSNPLEDTYRMRSDYIEKKDMQKKSPILKRVPEEDFENVIVVKKVEDIKVGCDRWKCSGGCLLCDR